MYLAPFLAPSWWASLKSREVQEKTLEEILEAIMDKSALVNPVHGRRIEFLEERITIRSHSNFLQKLEERIELIEFETLTKEALLSQKFLEESDSEIHQITTNLLAKNSKGGLDQLRPMVKTTEARGMLSKQFKKEMEKELEEYGALNKAQGHIPPRYQKKFLDKEGKPPTIVCNCVLK